MAYITGLGTSLPNNSVSQKEALEFALAYSSNSKIKEKVMERLYRRTEISNRQVDTISFFSSPSSFGDLGPGTAERMQRYAQNIVPLALPAVLSAITESGIKAESIGQLITVSCTGFFAPGLDLGLARELRLNPGVGRTNIGFMGCHGGLNALRVAQAFCATSHANVLICAAEICSLHFQYGDDTDHILANSLFSDGAAALVLNSHSKNDTHLQVVASGSFVIPDSAEAMTWTIGNNGFAMTLSPRVPDLIRLHLKSWLKEWLHSQNFELEQINSWAIHPGGPRILDAVQDALNLSDEALCPSRTVLAECGNMSSPTVFFILNRIRSLKLSSPCVILGFGPGMSIEAALLV
jgi:predicted naringenin-chalcone synthase